MKDKAVTIWVKPKLLAEVPVIAHGPSSGFRDGRNFLPEGFGNGAARAL